ncbi:MAG TPA: hypothetical protein VGX03_29785 [Candidatus Binatia bacterium]|jgi:hypothetical protein|nr:hypothetical protein [Candidatus Binatia bacterium]
MKSFNKWLSIDAPAGWADVFTRSVKAAVVAFVVLQLKEWFDAGAFDTPATAVDAALIAGATFVLNAILKSFFVPSVYLGLGSSSKPDPSRSQLG